MGPRPSAPTAACSSSRSASAPASMHGARAVGEQHGAARLLGQLAHRRVVDRLARAPARPGSAAPGQLDGGGGRRVRPPLAHDDLGDRLVALARLANEQVGGELGVLHPLDDVQLVALEGDGVDLERVPVRLPPLLGAEQILQRRRVGVAAQRRDQARVRGRVLRLQLQLAHVRGQRVGGAHAARLGDAGRLPLEPSAPGCVSTARAPAHASASTAAAKSSGEGSLHRGDSFSRPPGSTRRQLYCATRPDAGDAQSRRLRV